MRIVLATVDTDLRLAIQLLLSEEPGIKIVGSASDCDGLIALISSTHPDISLLDWDLPGCDIETVLRDIKLISNNTKMNMIVIGRHSRMRETVLQAGADEYVVIGDPPENLLEVFRQINLSKLS